MSVDQCYLFLSTFLLRCKINKGNYSELPKSNVWLVKVWPFPTSQWLKHHWDRMRSCTQAWSRNHKSNPGSLSAPRMSLSANYAFFRKEPSTETIFQSAEEGGNLNSALQCVSKELKKAWRNIHSTAFNITSHYRILLFLLMNPILEKQPAPNLKPGNVTVSPQRLSHIFLPPNPALQSDAWPRGHRATSWNTLTRKMMTGTFELFRITHNVHPPPPPFSWQGQSGRGQSRCGRALLP